MKRLIVLVISLILSFMLVSCASIKNLTEEEALNKGINLLDDFFSKEVYSNYLYSKDHTNYNYTMKKDKTSLVIEETVDLIDYKYEFKNDLLTVYDNYELVLRQTPITKAEFLRNYAGLVKIDLIKDNIKNHTTETKMYHSAKGGGKYYSLEQTLNFKEDIILDISILNNNYTLYTNQIFLTIRDQGINSIYLRGYQLVNDSRLAIDYSVSNIPK